MRCRDLLILGSSFLAGAMAVPALAQTGAWPSREVTIIVPVGPGASADATARAVAKVASRELNTPVIVKNIVGGGGLTGFSQMAASAPDGYTIGIVNVGALLIMPHTTTVPFTWDTFAFLGAVAQAYYGIGVAADSPHRTMADLVAAAKSGRVTFATSAPMNGISMFQIANETGAKIQMVMTATQPEAVAQAVGRHVDAVAQTSPEMIPLIEGKKLRLLASSSSQRWKAYPDVPTLRELGYNAANIIPLGFATQSGVPKAIRDRLEAAIAVAARDPELLETLNKFNVMSQPMTGAEFYNALKTQAPVVEKILEAAGMKKK